MALQMYQRRLINKLPPCLKFTAVVRNCSRRMERRDLDPNTETPYLSMKKRHNPQFLSVDILALLQRETLTWKEIKLKYKRWQEQKIKDDQRFLPERLKILGPDLAFTHFITLRGGKVKFINRNAWVTYENITNREIPSKFVPDMHLEAVNASGTNFCYESFDNLKLLQYLKALTLRNCPYIDDWCLHRLNTFENSLEYLDISSCHNVTERGVCTLYSLKNLTTLVLDDTPSIANKELTCLLLQDVLPQCNIIGVDYSAPSVWNRLKEYLT